MAEVTAGMNVAEVESLGTTLRSSADTLARQIAMLNKAVSSTAWQGPIASQFKQQWWPVHRARLAQIESDLRGFGQSAFNNATEQKTASAAGAGAAAGGAAGATTVGSALTLRELLRLPKDEQLAAWNALTPQEQRALISGKEASIGELDFVAPEIRYAANRQLIFNEYMALNELDAKLNGLPNELVHRKDLYYRILTQHEQVLFFDSGGDGRIAVVQGDLSHAPNVAISVPGISNNLDNYWGLLDEGHRLKGAAGADTAVVTWLGYDTPVGVGLNPIRMAAEIPNQTLAQPGADALVHFVAGVRETNPGAQITVIGHSYGSLVTGLAARQGMDANNVVFIGSPGVGANSVNDFHLAPGAHVYAAEPGAAVHVGSVGVGGDGVTNLGHNGHPFGGVPTEPGFGARVFDIGNRLDAGSSHSQYYADGSASLHALGMIASGEGDDLSTAW